MRATWHGTIQFENQNSNRELLQTTLDQLDERVSKLHKKRSGVFNTVDPAQIYMKEIRRESLLSAEEEIHYAQLALAGDQSAYERMVRCNLRLVVKVARRYLNRGLSLSDLIEEGNLGLIHAVGKFDPTRGFRFSTYATWWIRQSVERAIMNQSRTIRLPIHVAKALNRYLRLSRELTQTREHELKIEEIATELELEPKMVQQLLQLNEKTVSIDASMAEEAEKPLSEMLVGDQNLEPEFIETESDLKNYVAKCLSQLPEKQQAVLFHRFGLSGETEGATLDVVGQAVGLTRERVRQIQLEALKNLRRLFEADGVDYRELLEEVR